MSMQVFTALVKGGAIVPEDGVALPEGARVTVIADEREAPLELTPEQERELDESIAEADQEIGQLHAEVARDLSTGLGLGARR